MEYLDVETCQNEMEYSELEAECEELSKEWKEKVAAIAETMQTTSKYEVKADALINEVNVIQRR